jgi:hypothetical protein
MNDKIYRKIGGKYIECSDDDSLYMYLRDGFYLIHAYEGGRSISKVAPAKKELKAAMELAKDAMARSMLEASKLKPYPQTNYRKEKRAYAAYEKIMGPRHPASWIGESIYGIIEAGFKVLE